MGERISIPLENYCSRSTFAGSMRRARRTGPATESEPVSSIVSATAAITNGSCAVAWKTMTERTRLAATPSSKPASEPAGEQDQHASERGGENLLRLRTQRDANTQLAQPLADRVRGQAEGAGNREQESKSAKQAKGDGSHLGGKETHSQAGFSTRSMPG